MIRKLSKYQTKLLRLILLMTEGNNHIDIYIRDDKTSSLWRDETIERKRTYLALGIWAKYIHFLPYMQHNDLLPSIALNVEQANSCTKHSKQHLGKHFVSIIIYSKRLNASLKCKPLN